MNSTQRPPLNTRRPSIVTSWELLQEVLIDLEAVIAGVSNDNVAVISDCKALRAIQWVGRGVDK